MATRKVVPMKKRFRPNLALFIFLLIIIYIVVLTWGYLTDEHISIYEVNTTRISDDSPLYGFILRSEEVVTTDKEGYINYYNAEGNRVGTGDVVYTLDTNGEVSNMLETLQQSDKNKESITAMREVIYSFQNNFSLSSYSQIHNLKYDINNVYFEKTNGNLYSDLNKALKSAGQDKNFIKYTSAKNGILSYAIDGYENTKKEEITPELLDQFSQTARKQTWTSELLPAGSPAYKLITDNTWSLTTRLNNDYYERLKDLDTVRITISKDGISLNAAVELWDQGDIHYVSLTTTRFMERYLNDRFLQFEFNLKTAEGLKIPNSSMLKKDYFILPAEVITRGDKGSGIIKQVRTKEGKITKQFTSLGNYFFINDKYYVDSSVVTGGDVVMNHSTGEDFIVSSTEPLQGVYCVNEGFCEFRPVDILYQNKEYTIVSDSTTGGLSAFDHIVVDPSALSDDDFI